MSIELIDRASTKARLRGFLAGTESLEELRRWTGRIVAANDCEVVATDAPIVAQVINVLEDASLPDGSLRVTIGRLLTILECRTSDTLSVGLMKIAARHDRFRRLFDGLTTGTVSPVAFANALSKADLDPAMRRRIESLASSDRQLVGSALTHDDYLQLALLLE